MKKLIIAALTAGTMALSTITAFAAVSAQDTFICPGGDVRCTNQEDCIYIEDRDSSRLCPSPENCLYDGTHSHHESYSSHRGQGRGHHRGHHGC